MATVHVSAERVIRADPARVYGYLADYRDAHPSILPPAFSDYRVEEGGAGEGPVFTCKVTAGGRTRSMRARVTEPEPGRRLVERDENSSMMTVFTVTPEGNDSRVRFETTWESSGGIGGIMERLFAPMVLKRIYEEELTNLDTYAREHRPLGQENARAGADQT
jgi:uncharacterized protein YndB with AHSA1/START domain